MTDNAAPPRPAAVVARAIAGRRRATKREWAEQAKLAALLEQYLDPTCSVWTCLENRPRSWLSGFLQRKRGVRSGIPDVLVIWRGKPIFLELKSPGGVASRAQKRFGALAQAAGARWWLARTARAAMAALVRSGVPFRREWKQPPLAPWEGPTADPNRRLPQHPKVAAQRREANERWRQRRRIRKAAERAARARRCRQAPTLPHRASREHASFVHGLMSPSCRQRAIPFQ